MKSLLQCSLLIGILAMVMVVRVAAHDYGDALSKCILFFEGQRSGKLPSNQRMTWRKDSALLDGHVINMDLVGGYYDAGDNIKFNFPMAFTITVLSWSVLEFGQMMGSELQHALEAIRWGTDYLLKATSVQNTFVAQVGDPRVDHNCWERPEDMDTDRTPYVVDQQHPGTELTAEIAAALAASSMVFRNVDGNYAKNLLKRAKMVFKFGDKHRGSYSESLGRVVCPFYCDFNGYLDELVWGASWLYKATERPYYWKYALNNTHRLESSVVGNIKGVLYQGYSFAEFGWDAKQAGINVLNSLFVMNGTSHSPPFIPNADRFVCSILPESPTKTVTYSPGGLIFKPGPSNMQHPTALSFLLLVYARYLTYYNRVVHCGDVVAGPSRLVDIARGQIDYILGSNPMGMSYMVGYGEKFPQRIHHRGSTLPSIDRHPERIKCKDGTPYFNSKNPNPNLLVGAVVGGPNNNDVYIDNRFNVSQSEPTTYINAALVGVLAYFKNPPPSS